MKISRVAALVLTFVLTSPAAAQLLITVAGGNLGDGGPANISRIARPDRARFDAAGNLYIADMSNSRIRRVDAVTQVITTVAGGSQSGFSGDGGPATAATLSYPWDLAFDAAGNLYIADSGNYRVRKVDAATHIITTVAGIGTYPSTGDGGPATAAGFSVRALRFDSAGNLYIADTFGSRIRKVDAATQIITTVAGGGFGFGGDGGPATAALLNFPQDIAFDAAGNMYVADTNNDRIRRVDAATRIISTYAGTNGGGFSGDGQPATSAALRQPYGIAFDAADNLYIADTLNFRIRKVDAATKTISTVAGIGFQTTYGSDGGPATEATLSLPEGVALDSSNNLYIADLGNSRIRKVSAATSIISTFAGGTEGDAGDGGAAITSKLLFPGNVGVDASGNLYIADTGGQRVRRVDAATRVITTVAGTGTRGFSGDGSPATAAMLNQPSAVAVDAAGNVYIADSGNARVRRVDAATKNISTIVGNGNLGASGDGGPASSATIAVPSALLLDPSGNLYIADSNESNVRIIDGTTHVIRTFAGNTNRGFAGDGGLATNATLNIPNGLARDAAGNIYIADTFNHLIRKVNLAGIITSVPGSLGPQATPHGIAFDSQGALYVADDFSAVIWKVDPATGTATTFAGNGIGGFSGDGPARASSLGSPLGIAVDAAGNVYVADSLNHRIREVTNGPVRRRAIRGH